MQNEISASEFASFGSGVGRLGLHLHLCMYNAHAHDEHTYNGHYRFKEHKDPLMIRQINPDLYFLQVIQIYCLDSFKGYVNL